MRSGRGLELLGCNHCSSCGLSGESGVQLAEVLEEGKEHHTSSHNCFESSSIAAMISLAEARPAGGGLAEGPCRSLVADGTMRAPPRFRLGLGIVVVATLAEGRFLVGEFFGVVGDGCVWPG